MNTPKILTITPLFMVTLCFTIKNAGATITGLTCWDSSRQCCEITGTECNESQCKSTLVVTCSGGTGPVVGPVDPVLCVKTCPAGEYGDICNDEECKPCPTPGTSAALSNKTITNCYIPAGTAFTDSTGTYEYTSKCYYTK